MAGDIHLELLVGREVLQVPHVRDERAVGLDGGLGRVWVVVNLDALDDVRDCFELDEIQRVVCRRPARGVLIREADDHIAHRRVRRGVDELAEPWDTERHVFTRDTGKVEGIERHLRGRLTATLRGDRADHLARVNERLLEAVRDLSEEPIKGLAGETQRSNDPSGVEQPANCDLEDSETRHDAVLSKGVC